MPLFERNRCSPLCPRASAPSPCDRSRDRRRRRTGPCHRPACRRIRPRVARLEREPYGRPRLDQRRSVRVMRRRLLSIR